MRLHYFFDGKRWAKSTGCIQGLSTLFRPPQGLKRRSLQDPGKVKSWISRDTLPGFNQRILVQTRLQQKRAEYPSPEPQSPVARTDSHAVPHPLNALFEFSA
jgi:hypothetical protein